MEHQSIQSEVLLAKVKEIDQATFFCFNESSQKLPVAVVKHLPAGFVREESEVDVPDKWIVAHLHQGLRRRERYDDRGFHAQTGENHKQADARVHEHIRRRVLITLECIDRFWRQ